MKIKRIVSSALAVTLMLTSGFVPKQLKSPFFQNEFKAEATSIVESGTCGENVTWQLCDDGVLTISGKGDMENYNSSPFIGLGKIKAVIIDNGITSIGSCAFSGLGSVENVTIPNTVTHIEHYAFWRCLSLTNISIPNSVKSIEWSAFEDCKNIEKINIPNSIEQINENTFSDCSKLKNIVIPDTVKKIDSGAFSGCSNLENVYISDSVTIISESAFRGCKGFTTIKIPDSVIYIGKFAFSGCTNVENITIGKSVEEIWGYAFSGCETIKKITIPNSVKKISEHVFAGCINLETAEIGNSLTSIGYGQFDGCTKLSEVKIPNSIKSIGTLAFKDCTSLESISLPDSIESIYSDAFENTALMNKQTGSIYYADSFVIRCDPELKTVELGENVRGIIDRALFGDSEDVIILNPKCKITDKSTAICNEINVKSFEGRYNGTIHGYQNSTAQEYAEKYNCKFESLGEYAPSTTEPSTTEPLTTEPPTSTVPVHTTKSSSTTTSEVNNIFIDGINNWNIYNKDVGSYYINKEYKKKLLEGLSETEKYNVEYILDGEYGGACYGMAATSILSCYGILKPYDYQKGANFLHDIDSPPTNDVKSLINYYFALQVTDEIYQYTTESFYKTEKEKTEKLLKELSDGSPVLLTFFIPYAGGHAVVAYGVEHGSYVKNKKAYNIKILIYDNNRIEYDDDYCMYINTSNYSWTIPGYYADSIEGATIGLTTDDLNIINYHGYLNGNENNTNINYIPILSSKAIAADFSLRKIDLSGGSWTINTSSNEDIKMFSSCTLDSTGSDLKFAIRDTQRGCVMNLLIRQ